jgi:hypothetical protein
MSEMRDLDAAGQCLVCGGIATRHCLPDVFGHLRGVFGGEVERGWRFVLSVLQVMAVRAC